MAGKLYLPTIFPYANMKCTAMPSLKTQRISQLETYSSLIGELFHMLHWRRVHSLAPIYRWLANMKAWQVGIRALFGDLLIFYVLKGQ